MQSKQEGVSLKENGATIKEEQDGLYRIAVCSLEDTAMSLFRRGDFEMAEPIFLLPFA